VRTDFETNNFVGVGEDSAYTIIQNIFKLEERKLGEFPFIGIYRQFPLYYLFTTAIFSSLRSDLKKGSIDILVIDKSHRMIACRVQGKKGDLKMQRENLQKVFLESSLVNVVDIHKRECKELFKERVNEKSIQEIRDSFKTARVDISNG